MRLQEGKFFSKKLFHYVFIILSVFTLILGFQTVEAAKKDMKAPTAPTNLQSADITESSVTLAWNESYDDVSVADYLIYQDNRHIGTASSTQYVVGNLRSNTSYRFYVQARDTSGNLSKKTSNILQVTTKTKTVNQQPPIVGDIAVSPIASDNKTISGMVSISVEVESDTKINKVEFYSNNGGYLIGTVSSAPYTVNWATDPWVPDGEQILKVIAYDSANQTTEVFKTVTVNNSTIIEPVENEYKLIGYYAGWATYSGFQVTDIDASKLTHINYAFANISDDGKISLGDPWADVEKSFPGDTESQPFKGNFHQLNKLKEQYPHIKTIISIGGWSWSEKFSDVALTEESRTTFANSVRDFMLKYGFDGVDLDWEYPVGGGKLGNINRPEDKENFTLLLKKIRETLAAQTAKDGNEYLLTIATGASKSHANNMELNKLHQYVDYLQLMTYDIHGEWDSFTGMNAPLYRDPNSGLIWEWSAHDAVQTYLENGVPANKLVMGLPFYGRVFYQTTNANHGLYQSFASGGSMTYGQIAVNYVNKNGYTRYWQNDSKVPWLYNGTTFISYDDVESIGYKTDYIRSNELGGAMMWELSQDPNKELLTKIYHDLN
ncbi:glycosyl hydrolase family 18 protein [Anaerobacillus sp. MEB173]|uniref:glycosyl hydrolase family 18 protein n=1 Tax=Anaerobacillus sp. MEB173 TaxID=3383345 RepID=UPI003F92D3F3